MEHGDIVYLVASSGWWGACASRLRFIGGTTRRAARTGTPTSAPSFRCGMRAMTIPRPGANARDAVHRKTSARRCRLRDPRDGDNCIGNFRRLGAADGPRNFRRLAAN